MISFAVEPAGANQRSGFPDAIGHAAESVARVPPYVSLNPAYGHIGWKVPRGTSGREYHGLELSDYPCRNHAQDLFSLNCLPKLSALESP